MDENSAIGIVGPLGSGKSTVGELFEKEIDTMLDINAVHTEVSDFCRVLYEESHGDESDNDNALGRWTANVKAEEGDGYFVRRMAEQHVESDKVTIISGLRSPKEAEAMVDVFDDVTIVAVWTLSDLRFRRKYCDEDDSAVERYEKEETFEERNRRELYDWRCVEFYRHDYPLTDYVISNNGSKTELRDQATDVLYLEQADRDSLTGTYFNTPFVSAMDDYLIARYV